MIVRTFRLANHVPLGGRFVACPMRHYVEIDAATGRETRRDSYCPN